MTRQAISTGSSANDGTGDTLRSASQKINENFVELYNFLGGDSNTLASKVSLNDSAVVFASGSRQTIFEADISSSANNTITLPQGSGSVVLDTAIQILTNKALTSPTITNPTISTTINGAGGDEIIELGDAGSSSVNHVKVSNAATGNHAKIEATGDDANVNLLLEAKNTGAVDIKRVALRSVSNLSGAGNYTTANSHVIMTGGSYTSNLQNGSVAGEVVVFTNSTSGIKTIQPASFAQGSTIALDQYDAVTLIWDGSNWYIAGHYGATVA